MGLLAHPGKITGGSVTFDGEDLLADIAARVKKPDVKEFKLK